MSLRLFIVVVMESSEDPSGIFEKLDQGRFPDTYQLVKPGVWLVRAATSTTTTGDLVDALAPEGREEIWPDFLVVKAAAYHGVAVQDLWEKLKAWEEA